MNRRDIYLHIGTQKTGSTTIQTILSKHKPELRSEGISYLGRFPELARRVRTAETVGDPVTKDLKSAISDQVHQNSGNGITRFIVSNEKFSGDKMQSHSNARAVASILKEAVSGLQLNVKVIVYLRRQDSYIESTYAQKVYSGYSGTFDDFLSEIDEEDFHWDQFLKFYSDAFGIENLIVYPFDKKYLPEPQSLIQHFGETVGSTLLASYSEEVVVNQGFTRNSLNIAKITNQWLDSHERRQLREILKKYDHHRQNNIFFNTEERERLLSRYAESNRRVAEVYLPHFEGTLFSDPDYSNIDSQRVDEHQNAEELLVSLAQIMLNLNSEFNQVLRNQNKNNTMHRHLLKKAVSRLRNIYR